LWGLRGGWISLWGERGEIRFGLEGERPQRFDLQTSALALAFNARAPEELPPTSSPHLRSLSARLLLSQAEARQKPGLKEQLLSAWIDWLQPERLELRCSGPVEQLEALLPQLRLIGAPRFGLYSQAGASLSLNQAEALLASEPDPGDWGWAWSGLQLGEALEGRYWICREGRRSLDRLRLQLEADDPDSLLAQETQVRLASRFPASPWSFEGPALESERGQRYLKIRAGFKVALEAVQGSLKPIQAPGFEPIALRLWLWRRGRPTPAFDLKAALSALLRRALPGFSPCLGRSLSEEFNLDYERFEGESYQLLRFHRQHSPPSFTLSIGISRFRLPAEDMNPAPGHSSPALLLPLEALISAPVSWICLSAGDLRRALEKLEVLLRGEVAAFFSAAQVQGDL